ncbi:transcriptional regulator, AraC family with amidase-like domain [Prosthecobacter debontii]|uniref:Transcriptional regulator, AraC family with amidase-like domain n=1 Tax=Prosthecobacter debontii TaxID=48467 RepID=A0A1T4YZB9_9BACT|nr:GlxA family transcriptional regulator [Prosthecobacter debontii]SKB07114.1 transcriptional regulator, AraC family with amidase-like domain [Prosthecobacter debontii]
MIPSASNRRIVILMYPRVRELDVAGVTDVFSTANTLLPAERRYQITYAATEAAEQIEGMYGLGLRNGPHYSTLRGRIDTVIVPGGMGSELSEPPAKLLTWLRKQATTARRMGSVCTGAWLLAQAGLLDGRRATTHWAYARELASSFPKVIVDPNPIWVKDGCFYSSAGATSGIDLSLALVEEDHGRKIALEVARMLVVFLCRPGNQAQFSVSLREQTTEDRPLRDLQVWMQENLTKDLSVPALATKAAMSERNFQRVFTREIGMPPSQYVEEMRIEAVRRKLERSTQGMEEIAQACGFSSADVMGRSFMRQLHITPTEYRSRFRSSGI